MDYNIRNPDNSDYIVVETDQGTEVGRFDPNGFTTPSINTEESVTKTEPVYNVEHWGAVGDGSTDDTTAIQNAIDQANADGGGTVFVPDGTYICAISLKSNVSLELDDAATLKLPDNTDASVVSCATGATNIFVSGGTIDGNRPNAPDSYIHGIGFGDHSGSEGATHYQIHDVKVVNCKRHGISMFQCQHGHVTDCLFDDASGDDDLSVEESQDVSVERCVSINKTFSYDGRPASFEVEDDSKRVRFNRCYAIGGDAGTNSYVGFLFKTHSGDGNPPCKDIEANECYVLNSAYRGFEVVVANGTHERHAFNDCVVVSPGQDAFRVDGGSSGLDGMSIDNCSAYNADRHGLNAIGTVEGLEVDGFLADECTNGGIIVNVSGGAPSVSDSIARDCGGDGISVATADGSIADCKAINNGGQGLYANASRVTVSDSLAKNNGSTAGIYVNASDVAVRDCEAYDDQATKTQDHSLFISSGLVDVAVRDCDLDNGATRCLKDNGADRTLLKDNEISGGVALQGTNERLFHNIGYVTEASGSDTQSGDGSSTTFTIAHGMNETPTTANVEAGSADAAGDFYVSNLGGSNIEIAYATAPSSGTDNLTWYWEAKAR